MLPELVTVTLSAAVMMTPFVLALTAKDLTVPLIVSDPTFQPGSAQLTVTVTPEFTVTSYDAYVAQFSFASENIVALEIVTASA